MEFEELYDGMVVRDISFDEEIVGVVCDCSDIHNVMVCFDMDNPEESSNLYCFNEDCDDYCGDDLIKAEPKTGLDQLSNSLKNLHKNKDEEY